MNKLYICGLGLCLVCVAYFYGEHVGYSKCQIQNYQTQINEMNENSKKERILNDKVYKTSLSDIRSILHDKYSIAE